MPYYFYVLRSKKDGGLYKGVAGNAERRLAQHNAGKTRSLKYRIPLTVSHLETAAQLSLKRGNLERLRRSYAAEPISLP